MGLILDTSIVIDIERRGDGIEDLLRSVRDHFGDGDAGLSAVSVVELTHGIYRAARETDRTRRRRFTDEVFEELTIYPLTREIAQLAGRIEGLLAAAGQRIAFEDLAIGATALHLNFAVATLNVRHFERIPGLELLSLTE